MDLNATIIGQSIAFFVFVWFCMKFVWPPIVGALEERQRKIAEGLESAGRAEKDLELTQERVSQMLKEAKTSAAGIIEQANKRANQIIDEAKSQAREEGQRIRAGAEAEIEQEINQAKEALRGQVAHLAVIGAERILETSIDENAHRELTEKLASSL